MTDKPEVRRATLQRSYRSGVQAPFDDAQRHNITVIPVSEQLITRSLHAAATTTPSPKDQPD